MKNKFYITTPVYYVNDVPHIGHAYTTIAADTLARFHRAQGDNVFLLTGTDEHGLKIQRRAEDRKEDPQKFVDEIAGEFKNLWDRMDIKYDSFIRTTGESHKGTVQKVLEELFNRGAIYKGEYEGLYCVGCEQFRNENELVNGRCPDHDTVLENVREECYLLKMGDLQNELVEKIEKDELKIRPERYKKEIFSFLKSQPLKDISISRKNVSWGIPLPFDTQHTTYVWVDAFLNYLTGLGWEGDLKRIPEKWPADIQLIGKDILRVHATIWPIMLMHLGIELPKMIFVHGHILSGGRKMSKTIGNVIGIDEMLEKFGVDGTRYLLMSAGTFGEDVDVTMERMIEKYNADLANGIGNLLSRAVKLCEGVNIEIIKSQYDPIQWNKGFIGEIRLDMAINRIWHHVIGKNNKYIDDNKPWELKKTDELKFREIIQKVVSDIYFISELLNPFMPETSEKIKKALETKEMERLFPRIK